MILAGPMKRMIKGGTARRLPKAAVHGFMTASPGPAGIPLANGPAQSVLGAETRATAAGDCVHPIEYS